jgi:hypothetical protein
MCRTYGSLMVAALNNGLKSVAIIWAEALPLIKKLQSEATPAYHHRRQNHRRLRRHRACRHRRCGHLCLPANFCRRRANVSIK